MAGRTFVVGYDGSAEAERALARAAELAAALGAVLVVAEIAAPMLPPADIGAFGAFDLPYPPPGAESDVTDAIWERHRAHVAEVLDGNNVAHDFVSSRGDAAPALMALAEQRGAELIVVGTREAGFFDRLLTGSVSGEVARKAHCDVLIVHGHADTSG